MERKTHKFEVVFAEGITLQEVNPESHAMKPPYMDSIVSISLEVLPILGSLVNGLRIEKGFFSRKSLFANKKSEDKIDHNLILHTKGKALEVSWNNFDSTYLSVVKDLFSKIKSNMHIVIYENSIGFYKNKRDKRLIRKDLDGKESVISKETIV